MIINNAAMTYYLYIIIINIYIQYIRDVHTCTWVRTRRRAPSCRVSYYYRSALCLPLLLIRDVCYHSIILCLITHRGIMQNDVQ